MIALSAAAGDGLYSDANPEIAKVAVLGTVASGDHIGFADLGLDANLRTAQVMAVAGKWLRVAANDCHTISAEPALGANLKVAQVVAAVGDWPRLAVSDSRLALADLA